MIKVDIISGFLGAGKTTLIKKLFEGAFVNEKIVLIENEFGEIGIDGSFLKESGVNIKEINSGCICCSLVGDFEISLKEVIDTYTPDRVIIEPSGVGKLSDIIEAVKKVDIPLQINIVATVVDGTKAAVYMKNFGEFFNNQIETANTIIISKLDKASSEKAEAALRICKEHNSEANIVTTPINELSSNSLLFILEEGAGLRNKLMDQILSEHEAKHECCGHHHEAKHECCGHHHETEHECCGHHHGHDADEVFVNFSIETIQPISKKNLDAFLKEISNEEEYGMVLRSKGILKASDSDTWYYFDYVGGEYEIREGNPDFASRLVVIGSNISKEKIEVAFEKRNS